MLRFHVFANPENRRFQLFKSAATEAGHRVGFTSYQDWIEKGFQPDSPNTIYRIESPGENTLVNRLLLKMVGIHNAPHPTEFRHQQSWMCAYEKLIGATNFERYFISPTDIVEMFDKEKMYTRLQSTQTSLPYRYPNFKNFEELQTYIKTARVFIKPTYGSSASGMLACSIKSDFVKCSTSLEIHQDKFFNSLRIRNYAGKDAIQLINYVLSEGAVVEAWYPKASISRKAFDIRVVCIGGKAQHMVVRTSSSPFMNLHLGNDRGSLKEVVDKFGKHSLLRIQHEAERAAAAFPTALYLGVDVGLSIDGKHAVVFEVNAFGDLLPDIKYKGRSTYTCEILEAERRFTL